MKRTILFGLTLFTIATLSAGAAFAADPSLHEVYQAAEAGHLKQAEAMMGQVLRDHPNSAKAHFVEAELLAKEGQLDMARSELGTAERLSPDLPFAKRDAIESLKSRLNSPTRLVPSAAPLVAAAPANNFPWSLLLVGLALIATVIFFVRSLNRSRVLPAGGGAGYAPAGTGYGPNGYPQPAGVGGMGQVAPVGGGMGSGILGGLATGAAMGAGMVAGEALMHRVFDGGGSHAADVSHQQPADYPATPDTGYGMGGNDFGISDGGSWDDSSAGGGMSDDWS